MHYDEVTKSWVVFAALGLQLVVLTLLHLKGRAETPPRLSSRAKRSQVSDAPGQSTAFASLGYYRLPPGTLRRWCPVIYYAGEQLMPATGLGRKRLDYLANIIWVIHQKSGHLNLRRCSAPDAEHLLLLVDHHVGIGRHVWCLLDITRPAGGEDLSVKFYRLIPRHLDIWDWSLLRHVGFPLIFLWDFVASAAGGHRPEENFAQWFLVPVVIGCSLITGIAVGLTSGAMTGLIAGGSFFVAAAFAENLIMAKKPLPDMERHSAELLQLIADAVQTATIEMPRD